MAFPSDQKASDVGHSGHHQGSYQWNVRFIRAAHDWEIGAFSNIFSSFDAVRICHSVVDKMTLEA